MAARSNNNLVDNILDTQKKVLDSVVENTKKFTTGTPLNETIEKGNDWYKNWLETQKSFFTKATGQATATENGKAKTEAGKEKATTANTNEILENWLNTQATWAKQIWEMSQESAKKFGVDANTNPFANWQNAGTANPFTNWMGANANPFANWQNAATNPFAAFTGANANPFANWQNSNPMAAWMNQATTNNWMNQMQNANPFTTENFKKATDTVTDTFNKYYSTLNNSFAEWQKNFENGTVQDAYKNMINSGEGFTKFAEMWMPMIKSMQEKTFSMDEYKKLMNPELYKEFMDKFFGLMPAGSREQMDKMTAMMNDNMSKMTDAGMNGYQQMREMMDKMSGEGSKVFGTANSAYTNWYNQMHEAAAPFAKMTTPNQHTKSIQEWSDISNRIMLYNMKNAELQYMIYNQGTKVMDKLAETTAKKIKDGAEVTSIIGLYQEWLNISDKVYVSLFESTEYSQLMAEVGSMQMKLRKDIDLQNEKMLKDIPVATRSEMDEVYHIIYDLKKKVRQLEQMLDMEGDEEPVAAAPKARPAAKKAAKRTTRK